MCAPKLNVADFFSLTVKLGCDAVEVRNDLDGAAPEEIKAGASRSGVRMIFINALQRHDAWDDARAEGVAQLSGYKKRCGAEALVLVPTNDGWGLEANGRRQNLRQAYNALQPPLEDDGYFSFEPLAAEDQALAEPAHALGDSMSDIRAASKGQSTAVRYAA